jgi:hypothetical protein
MIVIADFKSVSDYRKVDSFGQKAPGWVTNAASIVEQCRDDPTVILSYPPFSVTIHNSQAEYNLGFG